MREGGRERERERDRLYVFLCSDVCFCVVMCVSVCVDVSVCVNASGYNELAHVIYRFGTTWYDQIFTNLSVNICDINI